jgi:hypothetical protein
MIDRDCYENKRELTYAIEEAYEWRKWCKEIPFINFPPNFLIQVVPPFGGAVIRFRVNHKKYPDKQISVYLDCYDMLGGMEGPYWEIYPAAGGDVNRCSMNETEELIKAIQESFDANNDR